MIEKQKTWSFLTEDYLRIMEISKQTYVTGVVSCAGQDNHIIIDQSE
jgi:hypothetical protein